jgi:acetyl-CoA carboxylase biotin carboxyl carrier protein
LSLSAAEIRAIVETLQGSDWDQATVVVGDVQISVGRNGVAPTAAGPASAAQAETVAPAPAPAPPSHLPQPVVASTSPTAPVAEAPDGHVITSPTVGVVWRSPEPGAAPFVKVGTRVQPGDTLAIVEIMKLMSNISSDVAGEVIAIHVDNAGAVEFGSPLFTIRLEG